MAQPSPDPIDRAVPVHLTQIRTPSDIEALGSLAATSPPVVLVVSADLGADLDAVVRRLGDALREVVFFDSVGSSGGTGLERSFQALDELGLGQDFVYTVPALEAAVDHAVAQVAAPDSGFEGRTVVVVGPPPVIERARRHLTGTDGPPT